jgi:general secretion pathway protein G
MMKAKKRGFTLIELMMVVSIIAILASIAMPKFADMLIKAQEGSLKGNIGSMRSALSIYYSDNQGLYPNCTAGYPSAVFAGTLAPAYIPAIPAVNNTLHVPTNNVFCDSDANILGGAPHDSDGWYYDGTNSPDQLNGSIWVACNHTDTVGTTWTSY